MTSAFAIHLIEQFAEQAPFAVWITDSRGIGIFANKRLHAMFDIPDHPSRALGVNLFEDRAVACLRLGEAVRRAKKGEVVDLLLDIKAPDEPASALIRRREPLTLKLNCYSLLSGAGKVEHYVVVMSDVTEKTAQREKLRRHLQDLTIFNASRDSRLARRSGLQAEADALEEEIVALGGTPTETA